MAVSMADILAQAGRTQSVIQDGSDQITSLLADSATLSMNTSDLLKQAADDASLVSTTKSAADLSTQTARQQVGIAFGTDMNAQNQVMTMLSGEALSKYGQMQQLSQTIQQKQSIDPMSDPLGYLIARFSVNDDIAAHNSANADRQAALDQIDRLNKATSETAQNQQLFASSITVASAAAAARLASDALLEKANQSQIQANTFNAQGIQQAMSASKETLASMFQVKQAQQSESQLAISQAHLDLANQEFQFRKDEKLKADNVDNSIVDSINLGRGIRGLPPMDAVKAQVALAALKGKGPASDEMMADYTAGERSLATGSKTLGVTGSDVLGRLMSPQAIALGDNQQAVKSVMVQAMQTAAPQLQGLDPKNVAGAQQIMNKAIADAFNAQFKEVSPGASANTNVAVIQPIAQTVKTSPAAAAEPLYTQVLAPLMATGVDLNNPNNVMAAAIKAVQDKTLTFDQASSGITTIYSAGAAQNLAQRDLAKFGLQGQIDAGIIKPFGYNVRIQPAGSVVSNVIDLTKPDVVSRYINQQLARQASGDSHAFTD